MSDSEASCHVACSRKCSRLRVLAEEALSTEESCIAVNGVATRLASLGRQLSQLDPDLEACAGFHCRNDWARTARFAVFAGAFGGPVGHYWYKFLDGVSIMMRTSFLEGNMSFG